MSVNFDPIEITPEFLVLHYTAVSLAGAVKIFQNPQKKSSCHLLIDRDGSVYEIIPCLQGRPLKAWHAGESEWGGEALPLKSGGALPLETRALPPKSGAVPPLGGVRRDFNNFSIGVELVNLNGNLFVYTKAQYRALSGLLSRLKKLYPALENPERIVGHEHIASRRGKVDPGHCFNWPLFFKMSYPLHCAPWPKRKPALPLLIREQFLKDSAHLLQTQNKNDRPWILLNTQMEQSTAKKFSR